MVFDKKELDLMAERIIKLLVSEYQAALIKARKIASKKTFDSLAGDADVSENKVIIRISANQGLQFIISGRRKGAKLPVRKVGDGFELVPELQEWKVAVGFGGSDYLLARAISERGIVGVPITQMVLDSASEKINDIVRTTMARIIRDSAIQEIRTSFRQIV